MLALPSLQDIAQAPASAFALIQQLQNAGSSAMREARGGVATRLLERNLEGPIRDAHSGDAGPTEFDVFDTSPTVGAGVLSAVVGAELVLYAQVSNTSEAGLIIIGRATQQQWSLIAGAGGWQGWGVSNLAWSLGASTSFQATYNPIPSQGAGYMCPDYFFVDFCSGPNRHSYKPLHGMTIDSGGQITIQLTVRALGPAGTTVIWPGAHVEACSTKACEMLGQMTVWDKDQFGPLKLKPLFKAGGTTRLTAVRGLLTGGALSRTLSSIGPLLGSGAPSSATPPVYP
jgi:hypothetical protein